MAAQREQLEAANARYEKWTTDTSSRRGAAWKAMAELERRGLVQQTEEKRQPEAEGERQTMVEWWRRLETDLAAVDRALEREHQAALAAGKSWPLKHPPQHESWLVLEQESSPESDSDTDGQPDGADQMARHDELLAQAIEAAERFTREKTDREARAEYTARLEREVHAEPERTLQTEASYEAEIEL